MLRLTALLAGVALLLTGSGLLGTLLAVRGGEAGFGAGTLGLVMSGYFAGFFIGTFFAPSLIGRIGHIRAFAFFADDMDRSRLIGHEQISRAGQGHQRGGGNKTLRKRFERECFPGFSRLDRH